MDSPCRRVIRLSGGQQKQQPPRPVFRADGPEPVEPHAALPYLPYCQASALEGRELLRCRAHGNHSRSMQQAGTNLPSAVGQRHIRKTHEQQTCNQRLSHNRLPGVTGSYRESSCLGVHTGATQVRMHGVYGRHTVSSARPRVPLSRRRPCPPRRHPQPRPLRCRFRCRPVPTCARRSSASPC